MSRICAEPGCPERAVARGLCPRHRKTTSARGYGTAHQRERAAALPGARCEACGCTRNLQRDHRVPVSLGGAEDPSNKRWLCSCSEHACHAKFGVRADGRGGVQGPEAGSWNPTDPAKGARVSALSDEARDSTPHPLMRIIG